MVSQSGAEAARPADLTRGPGHRAGVVEGEHRDPLEPDLEGDPELHPRQVRTEAAVDAQAEGGMPVDLAVDDDLIRPVELRRVTVGRRERQQDPVVGLHVDAVPVHVLLDQPRHRDRRVGPEELLHRGGSSPGSATRRSRSPGSSPGATRTRRWRSSVVSMPAMSSRAIVPATCDGSSSDRRAPRRSGGGEVVPGSVQVVVDLREQVVEQPGDPLDAVSGCRLMPSSGPRRTHGTAMRPPGGTRECWR